MNGEYTSPNEDALYFQMALAIGELYECAGFSERHFQFALFYITIDYKWREILWQRNK